MSSFRQDLKIQRPPSEFDDDDEDYDDYGGDDD